MAIVVFFTLGSGICGGATSGAMLIAGRAVQGIGSGGIYIIIDIIVSDLVPLRVRGNYMSVVLIVYTVGLAMGPWVGGIIVERTTWRWVFYLTLPVSSNLPFVTPSDPFPIQSNTLTDSCWFYSAPDWRCIHDYDLPLRAHLVQPQ